MCSYYSFSSHCMDIFRKAVYIANAILYSFLCKDISVHMKAFDAYARPILEYCCFVWSPILCRNIDMVEKVQKTFRRRVLWKFNLPVMSYVDRLQFSYRNNLEHRRLVLSLCMFHRIFNRFVHFDVLMKNFFSLKMLRIWNSLHESIVSSTVMTAFKRRICKFNLSDYLQLNEC